MGLDMYLEKIHRDVVGYIGCRYRRTGQNQ